MSQYLISNDALNYRYIAPLAGVATNGAASDVIPDGIRFNGNFNDYIVAVRLLPAETTETSNESTIIIKQDVEDVDTSRTFYIMVGNMVLQGFLRVRYYISNNSLSFTISTIIDEQGGTVFTPSSASFSISKATNGDELRLYYSENFSYSNKGVTTPTWLNKQFIFLNFLNDAAAVLPNANAFIADYNSWLTTISHRTFTFNGASLAPLWSGDPTASNVTTDIEDYVQGGILASYDGKTFKEFPALKAFITNYSSSGYYFWNGNFNDFLLSFTICTDENIPADTENEFFFYCDPVVDTTVTKTIWFKAPNGNKCSLEVTFESRVPTSETLGSYIIYPNKIYDDAGNVVYDSTTSAQSGWMTSTGGTYRLYYQNKVSYRTNGAYTVYANTLRWLYADNSVNPNENGLFIGDAPIGTQWQTKFTNVINYTLTDKDYDLFDKDVEVPEVNIPSIEGDLGEDATGGGGTGDFDNSSDSIPPTSDPVTNFTGLNLFTMYKMSPTIASSFSNWLFDPDTFEKISRVANDPFEYLMSFEFFPFNITGVSDTIKYGGVDSDIPANRITETYVVLTSGWLDITEYWGSFLDYSPHTTIDLYLPYYSTVSLDVDEVMNSSIKIDYKIDIFTGTALIMVNARKYGDLAVEAPLYSYECKLSTTFPLTALNYTNQLIGTVSAIGAGIAAIGATVATKGTATPMVTTAVAGGLTALNNTKPSVQRGGTTTASCGLYGIQYPYLIISRPVQHRPAGYDRLVGNQSTLYASFASLSGFTKILNCELQNIPCTENELQEIEALLKSGVIF